MKLSIINRNDFSDGEIYASEQEWRDEGTRLPITLVKPSIKAGIARELKLSRFARARQKPAAFAA